MKHVMIDLETLGDTAEAVVLSIGAVQFEIETGNIIKEIHIPISLEDSLKLNRKVSAGTILWWMGKSEEARNQLLEDQKEPLNVKGALTELNKFIHSIDDSIKNISVWGKGPRFDMGILTNLYESICWQIPWYFRNEFCVRTMEFLDPAAIEATPDLGVIHNPVDDCKFQISYICKTYEWIRTVRRYKEQDPMWLNADSEGSLSFSPMPNDDKEKPACFSGLSIEYKADKN